jgi:hypothetical protein
MGWARKKPGWKTNEKSVVPTLTSTNFQAIEIWGK